MCLLTFVIFCFSLPFVPITIAGCVLLFGILIALLLPVFVKLADEATVAAFASMFAALNVGISVLFFSATSSVYKDYQGIAVLSSYTVILGVLFLILGLITFGLS